MFQVLFCSSRLTIIPQTPCIFNASVRDNLDPLHLSDDHQIWNTIEVCHLKPLIEKLGDGLDGAVGQNGRNLSAGEKQLVSLARAILSKSKVSMPFACVCESAQFKVKLLINWFNYSNVEVWEIALVCCVGHLFWRSYCECGLCHGSVGSANYSGTTVVKYDFDHRPSYSNGSWLWSNYCDEQW